jgi:hypothetical protein
MAELDLLTSPPLKAATVDKFEQQHRISLPLDYRAFVSGVANTAKGPPQFGLQGLGEVPSDYHRKASEVLRAAANPFPLAKTWIWEDEPGDTTQEEAKAENGFLVLGSEGCGRYPILIVTGAAAGQIWQFADVGIAPEEPRLSFVDWVERWVGVRWGGTDSRT